MYVGERWRDSRNRVVGGNLLAEGYRKLIDDRSEMELLSARSAGFFVSFVQATSEKHFTRGGCRSRFTFCEVLEQLEAR